MPVKIPPGSICHCTAYPFPHRPGSGKCLGPGDALCAACGAVASGEVKDLGIGAYEYWGAKGVDKRMCFVSTCCDAPLVRNQPGRNRMIERIEDAGD